MSYTSCYIVYSKNKYKTDTKSQSQSCIFMSYTKKINIKHRFVPCKSYVCKTTGSGFYCSKCHKHDFHHSFYKWTTIKHMFKP